MPFYNESKGPKLFSSCFSSDLRSDFDIYAKGYWDSAGILAKGLITQSRFGDYEAYPVVFLYRHSMELYLKHLIYQTADLASINNVEGLKSKLVPIHPLKELCGVAIKNVEAIFGSESEQSIIMNRIAITCSEFDDIDPRSFSFRYPITNKGEPSTAAGLQINLIDFHEHMEEELENIETIGFSLNMSIDVAQREYIEESVAQLG